MPGVHLDAPQQPELAKTKPAPATAAPALPDVQPTAEQQEALKKVFQAERAAARLWEYRYLNQFLAVSSQLVLDWVAGVGITAEDAYDAL